MSNAEVLLYDEIGFWGTTAAAFAERLSAAGEGDLTLRINSPGGDITHGLAMYNLLLAERRKGRKITCVVDGLAASMGSILAMAGDEVHMAESSVMMIHNPWGLAIGDAEDMRKEAEVLDTFKTLLVSAYTRKTGKHAPTIARLMDEETWLSAAETVEEKFADKVLPPPKKAQARWNLARFSRVPADIASRFGAAKEGATPPAPPTAMSTTVQTSDTPQTQPADTPQASQTPPAQEQSAAERVFAAMQALTGETDPDAVIGAVEAFKAGSQRKIQGAAEVEKARVALLVDDAIHGRYKEKGADGKDVQVRKIHASDRARFLDMPYARVQAFLKNAPALESLPSTAPAEAGPIVGSGGAKATDGKATARGLKLIGHDAPPAAGRE